MLAMLKRLPHNLAVLDELHPILIELSDLALCAQLFQAAFEIVRLCPPTRASSRADRHGCRAADDRGRSALGQVRLGRLGILDRGFK